MNSPVKTTQAKIKANKLISLWLLSVICLVIAIIVLGGATRLTNSGLSITEWRPITGALPPLSHSAWLIEFEKYKQIPEFQAEHPDMTLAGFEFIYFMEWSHRQLGRLIGLAYALPFFIFLIQGRLSPRQKAILLAILGLIGLQGVIGWWMVASGLIGDRVDVSQYRLATHLGMAFIILGALFWQWRLSNEEDMRPLTASSATSASLSILWKSCWVLTSLIYLQIIAGAFVAGTHAGKSYNSWPLMDGRFIPDGYGIMSPFWRNLFENTAAIQFNHRLLAYVSLGMSLWVFITLRRHNAKSTDKKSPVPFIIFIACLLWQIILGIMTVLTAAPLNLSLLHQFSAIILFLSVMWMTWGCRPQHAQKPFQ